MSGWSGRTLECECQASPVISGSSGSSDKEMMDSSFFFFFFEGENRFSSLNPNGNLQGWVLLTIAPYV